MQELFLGLIFALGIPHCWCTCIAWKVQWEEATPFPPVNYFIIVRVCSDYLSIIRKATSPLHLWARSQFLLARTPPFLVFGLYRLRSQFLLNKLPWPSALTNLSRPSALTYLSRPSALTYLSRPSASTDFGFAEMRLRRFTILENSCFQLNLYKLRVPNYVHTS